MRASSPLTWTDPIQPEEELLNHKDCICRLPYPGCWLCFSSLSVFSYHFHKTYHNKELYEFTESHRLYTLQAGQLGLGQNLSSTKESVSVSLDEKVHMSQQDPSRSDS